MNQFAGTFFYETDRPKDILHKYAGTAGQGNPPPNADSRHLPGPGFLPAADHNLPEYTEDWSVSMAYISPQSMEMLLENAVRSAIRSPEIANFG